MSVGENIRKARKAIGMTQEELAEKIGVNRATISKYENGDISFSFERFLNIASALGVSAKSLVPLGDDR